jgi:hypothetical protein
VLIGIVQLAAKLSIQSRIERQQLVIIPAEYTDATVSAAPGLCKKDMACLT